MRRFSPIAIAGFALAAILLLLIAVAFVRRDDAAQDKLDEDDLTAATAAEPQSKCASRATYELIKREIFRQAADTRGRDQAAFDRIAANAAVRMERPLVKERKEDLDQLRCSGRLSVDLPPGLSVVGGRTSFSADIDYIIQPAVDGSGDVVMVSGADSIIVPLATMASQRSSSPPPGVPATEPQIDQTAPSPPQAAGPQPPSQANARPSFNCGYARTRGEVAVCRDPGLAALDRQMAAQYQGAASAADRRQQAVLRATRDAFLRYRDQCASDACIAGAYRDRMREIDDIMAGNWRPGR